MDNYIEVPRNLTADGLVAEFGGAAVEYYMDRIEERRRNGKTYYNPLKTIYLWATEDRRTNQGYYTAYRGYSRGKKHKNFGAS